MNGVREASIPSIMNTGFVSLVSNGLDILLKGLTTQTLKLVQEEYDARGLANVASFYQSSLCDVNPFSM